MDNDEQLAGEGDQGGEPADLCEHIDELGGLYFVYSIGFLEVQDYVDSVICRSFVFVEERNIGVGEDEFCVVSSKKVCEERISRGNLPYFNVNRVCVLVQEQVLNGDYFCDIAGGQEHLVRLVDDIGAAALAAKRYEGHIIDIGDLAGDLLNGVVLRIVDLASPFVVFLDRADKV